MGFHAGRLNTTGTKAVPNTPIKLSLHSGAKDTSVTGKAEMVVSRLLAFRRLFSMCSPACVCEYSRSFLPTFVSNLASFSIRMPNVLCFYFACIFTIDTNLRGKSSANAFRPLR